MTGNQLTYWANIERERANRAAEAIDKARINAQRYAAQLSYSASIYNANRNYEAAMRNIEAAEKRQLVDIQQKYDSMWFGRYGAAGLLGSTITGNSSVTSRVQGVQDNLEQAFPFIKRISSIQPGKTYSLGLLRKYDNPYWFPQEDESWKYTSKLENTSW